MLSRLSFKERSLLFGRLATIAYLPFEDAKRAARRLGFSQTTFYDRDGAQAYRFMSKYDIIIVVPMIDQQFSVKKLQKLIHQLIIE